MTDDFVHKFVHDYLTDKRAIQRATTGPRTAYKAGGIHHQPWNNDRKVDQQYLDSHDPLRELLRRRLIEEGFSHDYEIASQRFDERRRMEIVRIHQLVEVEMAERRLSEARRHVREDMAALESKELQSRRGIHKQALREKAVIRSLLAQGEVGILHQQEFCSRRELFRGALIRIDKLKRIEVGERALVHQHSAAGCGPITRLFETGVNNSHASDMQQRHLELVEQEAVQRYSNESHALEERWFLVQRFTREMPHTPHIANLRPIERQTSPPPPEAGSRLSHTHELSDYENIPTARASVSPEEVRSLGQPVTAPTTPEQNPQSPAMNISQPNDTFTVARDTTAELMLSPLTPSDPRYFPRADNEDPTSATHHSAALLESSSGSSASPSTAATSLTQSPNHSRVRLRNEQSYHDQDAPNDSQTIHPLAPAVDPHVELVRTVKKSKAFFIGMSLVEIPSPNVENTALGLTVDAMYLEGPSDTSGIRLGDIIVAIAGERTPTFDSFRACLVKHAVIGERLPFIVIRPSTAADSEPYEIMEIRVCVMTTDDVFRPLGNEVFFDTSIHDRVFRSGEVSNT